MKPLVYRFIKLCTGLLLLGSLTACGQGYTEAVAPNYYAEIYLKDGTHCVIVLHSGSAVTCNWKQSTTVE